MKSWIYTNTALKPNFSFDFICFLCCKKEDSLFTATLWRTSFLCDISGEIPLHYLQMRKREREMENETLRIDKKLINRDDSPPVVFIIKQIN